MKKTGCSFKEEKGINVLQTSNLPIPKKLVGKPVWKTVKGKMSK